MINSKKITWLHISDLHIDSSEDNDNSIVREAFLNDIGDLIDNGLELDFIIVTGDVANKGKIKDYAIANLFFQKLLERTKIEKGNLFIVPGNHDLDISKISKSNGGIFINELVDGKDNSRLNDIMQSILMESCGAKFSSFFKKISSTRYDIKNKFLGNYYRIINVEGQKIGIAGLNSAWLSQGKGESENLHMAVGERQIRDLIDFDSLKHNLLNICIYHHPMSLWLEFDKSKELIKNKFDFLLCGHFHRPGNSIDAVNASVELQAGALYYSREYHNGYSIYQFDPARRDDNVKMLLRMYSDNEGGFFAADNISYKNIVNGELVFTLKKKISC